MAFITFRASTPASGPGSSTVKGSPLTNAEIDANFKSLDAAKLEINGSAASLTAIPMGNAAGTLAVVNGGTGVAASTGTGSVVLSTSPTLVSPVLGAVTSGNISNCTSTSMILVTPNLGTPSTLVLTNATGLPLGSTGVIGTLTVGNGGTGLNALTDGGIPYAASASTIATSNRLKFITSTNSVLVNSNASASPPTVITGTVIDAHGVDTATTQNATAAQIVLSSYGGAPGLTFRRSNGTMSARTTIAPGDVIGSIASISYDTSSAGTNPGYGSGVSISLEAEQTWTTTAHGSRIVFNVAQNNTATPVERLKIANDGAISVTGSLAVSAALTANGGLTISGLTSTTGLMSIVSVIEKVTVSASVPPATTQYDVSTQAIQYYTSSNTANFTLNIRGNASTTFTSLLAVGQSMSMVLMVTNSTTAYYPNVIQVDGTTTGVSLKWQGGSAVTAGNASSIDMYGLTILKTGSSTYTVFAAQTQFA